MQDKFNEIIKRVNDELISVASVRELNDLKVKYVGKNGEVTSLLAATLTNLLTSLFPNILLLELSSLFGELSSLLNGSFLELSSLLKPCKHELTSPLAKLSTFVDTPVMSYTETR